MTDYRELIAEEQGTSLFDQELTKADVEIEGMATKMTEFCRNEGCQRSGGQICQSNVCGKCSSQIMYEDIAEYLHAAGYRKQSETIKEFAEEISEVMDEHAEQNGHDAEGLPIYVCDISVLQIEIEKLAEQFGKEE